MYFRKKSFQSAYLKCMSKSSLNGFSTGEHLSQISEAEILDLANKSKLDHNMENQRNATNLIHTVSAACKNIPYTDEAAKEARTKLFSMWYSIGPPAVFSIAQPGCAARSPSLEPRRSAPRWIRRGPLPHGGASTAGTCQPWRACPAPVDPRRGARREHPPWVPTHARARTTRAA